MKAPSDISPDITTLKPCDHQAFFEALDSPIEALRAAFRGRKETLMDPGANTPSND